MQEANFQVIDNFLNVEDFKIIKDTMMSRDIPWYFQQKVVDSEDFDNFYFTHVFYRDGIRSSDLINVLKPLIEKIDIKALLRIKGNLYPREKELKEHKPHTDYGFSHKGCIFSINTCDGFTRLKCGTKIQSVQNRALLFNPSEFHNSSTCTNKKARINININFF